MVSEKLHVGLLDLIYLFPPHPTPPPFALSGRVVLIGDGKGFSCYFGELTKYLFSVMLNAVGQY